VIDLADHHVQASPAHTSAMPAPIRPYRMMPTRVILGFPSQRGDILLRERSSPMGESRRKFDRDFREGAVRLVRETGKPIAQVARDLGVNEGTLGNWVNADRRRRDGGDGQLSEDERAELVRLRKENAELTMERDVLKRSVALWVKDAMGSR
jgi:transposase